VLDSFGQSEAAQKLYKSIANHGVAQVSATAATTTVMIYHTCAHTPRICTHNAHHGVAQARAACMRVLRVVDP
jgi:hypothetical protein